MTSSTSRKTALGAAALAFLLGAGVPPAGAAGRSACHRGAPPLIRDGFPQPQIRTSRHGRLETTLDARPRRVLINGQRVRTNTYGSRFTGPALVVCARDRMVVHVRNGTKQPTNLHTHGFHVSPSGVSDNVFRMIDPGETARTVIDIPRDNPSGSYWYHPHMHGLVEGQIYGGMAGPIVQEGGLDRLPRLRDIPQRWMFLQAPDIKDGKLVPVGKASLNVPVYVNGTINPTARIRPGQLQRWRIFNGTSDRLIRLRLDGQRFRLLSTDAADLGRISRVRTLLIPPGSRREVLVRGSKAGSYRLTAVPFRQFGGPSPTPAQPVVTVRSAGRPVAHDPMPAPRLSHPFDLRGRHVDRRRTIVFADPPPNIANAPFTINERAFDPHRVDVTLKLNAIEEWKLVNTAGEWHTFHIHINDFQIVKANGRRLRSNRQADNIALAPHSSTVIRLRPVDFTGKYVFHCHVTFHEDHGMMAVVQVVRNPTRAQQAASTVSQPGMRIVSSAMGAAAEPAPVATAAADTPFELLCPLRMRRREEEVV